MEPMIILKSINPSGTLWAVVEQTNETVYLYIQPYSDFESGYPMRSCWVKNLKPAPVEFDYTSMKAGEAPLLPAAYCAHPGGGAPFDGQLLSLIWFTSEDGAALLYKDEIIAIIPGWSLYMENPVSYASECVAATGSLFPLESTNVLIAETNRALQFMNKWSEEASPWPATQDYFLNSYEKVFGKHHQYFSIDGDTWPPMAIASFRHQDLYIFLSLGISQRPMPWVDFLYNDAATGYRRMELGVAVHHSAGDEMAMQLAQGIAGLAAMPWRKITWLGEGHTISSDTVRPPFESLILSSALYNGPTLPSLEIDGDKVNIYWVQPITQKEREFAHAKPNGGYSLIEKLIAADVSWEVKANRKPVV